MLIEDQLVAAGFQLVAGCDEAGRGACAGPLVAAAVILGDAPLIGLDDSKRLTASQRERLYAEIVASARAWSVVEIAAEDCDRGLQEANISALRRAVLRLDLSPDYVLCDGFAVDGLGVPTLGIWKGDQVARCVAAASVLAKVTRDRIMIAADEQWPDYGFRGHKGYVTGVHQTALIAHGPSPIHRMSYRNVQDALAEHAERARVGES